MPASIEQPISVTEWDFMNDLSALPENEEIITDFLLKRLQRGQIYTWVGPLLLTLNPNNEISTFHLYNSAEFDKHLNTSDIYGVNPHIFTVAAKAHNSLTKEFGRNCQIIIISGETGTGKTFNACKCLEFLSQINTNSIRPYERYCTYNVMQTITDACRLISAFATARTEKNEVSSRHGQLVKLHYKGDIISGATINSFLLERSRVTKGSCNFQIFYQMIFGMPYIELDSFCLSKNEYYDILNIMDCTKRIYFQESFQDTLKALDVLDFKPDHKKDIFQVLALIIHMGNIKFITNGEICTIDLNNNKSKEAVKNACALSSLTEKTMTELLTTILINPQSTWRKHTSYHRPLLTVDACRNRLHSIIRHLYDLLFHWVLSHANNILSIEHECVQWLGILDIFGFESFEKNGIEQLCVNYANERMQQYFIETYVENCRRDLKEEGFIQSLSNPQHTIHLYQERLGIIEENLFLTLNDACQSPMAISVSTIIQLTLKNLHNTQRKFLSESEGNFIIEHYSGSVAYSVEDLLSKNTDKVPNEISFIFNRSTNTFLRSLINIEEDQHLHVVKMSTKKRTMLAKLKYNIDTLIKELSKCELHYVRCVKPNRLQNHEWDRKDFHKQLACIGIFDALPLGKCKYSIRLCYRDFYHRYSKKSTEVVDVDKCKLILESIVPKRKLDTFVYFGKQLIFLTEFIFHSLEFNRRNYRIKCANKIKAFWTKHRLLQIKKIELQIVPATSEHLSPNSEVQDECNTNENNISIKLILDRESKESNTSEADDDVFITSPILSKYDNSVRNISINAITNEVTSKSKSNDIKNKLDHFKRVYEDHENWQKQPLNFKHQFEAENCIKNNIYKFMKDIGPNHFLKYNHKTGLNIYDKNMDIIFDDANNNLVGKHITHNGLYVSLTQMGFVESNDEKRYCAHYDTERKFCTVQIGPHPFFYKNGILSRRRLAAIPIRMHTRATCLVNSHILPHNELPKGLQDCL